MAKAIWNGKVIAESDTTETVEGNIYFPEGSLKREYFRPSSTTSTCPWKGQARYMSLLIDGQDNPDAAWYYPDPKPAARKIKGYRRFLARCGSGKVEPGDFRFQELDAVRPLLFAPLLAFALVACAHKPIATPVAAAPTLRAIRPIPAAPRAGSIPKLYFGLGPVDRRAAGCERKGLAGLSRS